MPKRCRIDEAARFGKVAVLMGGRSAEREVSLMSGRAVIAALLRRGVDAHAVDPTDGITGALLSGGFDRVWIALHGRGGEDGSLQGLLTVLGIPFTGSGVTGCAICMDKLRAKQLLRGAGFDTPDYAVVSGSEDFARTVERLGLPLMMKPAAEGSSIGLTKVERPEQMDPAWRLAADCGCTVFAEQWVHGAEYTATILQGQVLPLIRIDAANSFYDYQAKYFSEETRYICPAGLATEQEQRLRALALTVFDAVGAGGWGRVDFMLDDRQRPLIIEVNTVPGMTDHSLVPMAAQADGIGFDELVWRILETSFLSDGHQADGH